MLAVLFLTIDTIPNHGYWKQWRGDNNNIRFYVNAKDPTMKTPEGFLRLPQDQEVHNTAWGHFSLVLAHQALLRYALADFPSAKWFVLVSGDALPLKSVSTLFNRLKPNISMFDEYVDSEQHQQWGVMNEALLRCDFPNWWVDVAAYRGEDDKGSFCVFPETYCPCVSQFHILCHEHAQLIADMPPEIPKDFDALIELVGGVRFSLAADEVVPLAYLRYIGKDDNVRMESVMHAPIDPKSPQHVAAHKTPVQCSHLFGRKYPWVVKPQTNDKFG